MAEVVWTREALSSLDLISAYRRRSNPAAADRVIKRLLAAGDSLDHFPNRGRHAARGARELPVVPPYIIEYRVEGDRVFIRRIRHGRQRSLEE